MRLEWHHRLLGLGTGQETEQMDSELLRNQYSIGIPDYSVAMTIDVFERNGRNLLEGFDLCGPAAT